MNETTDLVERISAAISDMDNFLEKGVSDAVIVNEARDAAEELLKNFQDELRRREDQNILLRKENAELKTTVEELKALRENVLNMEKQLEKMRDEHAQALRQRDEAKAEASKIQALWNKVNR